MKQLIRYLLTNKFRLALLILFLVSSSICEYCWLYLPDDYSELKNLGLNAFTEIIGIMVTVAIVDKLIQEQEERKLLPIKIAAHRDVGHFINAISTLWITAYDKCVPIDRPKDEPSTMIFTPKYFNAIGNHLDLDALAPVVPERTWIDYLKKQEVELRQQGEKILERYPTILEPDIYNLIHKILNKFLNHHTGMFIIEIRRNRERERGESRASLLENYWYIEEDFFARTL